MKLQPDDPLERSAVGARGLDGSPRKRLLTCLGYRRIRLAYRYVGSDDQAGPNDTGQPAVDSYYETVA